MWGILKTTLGNSPASVKWMDNLTNPQTLMALGKRIIRDESGNGPQHLNNYIPSTVQPPWGMQTAIPSPHWLAAKITRFVMTLIEDNKGQPTGEKLHWWGQEETGRPWRRIQADFGSKRAVKLASEMKEPTSPLRAVLLAIAYDMALGAELTLILGMAGAGKTTVMIKALCILIRLINGEPGCLQKDKLLVLWTAQSHPPLDSASCALRRLTRDMAPAMRKAFCRFLKAGASGTHPIDVLKHDRKLRVGDAELVLISSGGFTEDSNSWPQLSGHEGRWGIHMHDEGQQFGQVVDLDAVASTRGRAHLIHTGDPKQTPALGNFADKCAVDWLQQLKAREIGIRSGDLTFASMREWALARAQISMDAMTEHEKEELGCSEAGWLHEQTLEALQAFILHAIQINRIGHELTTLQQVAGIGGSNTPSLALDMSHRLLGAPFHPTIIGFYPDLCSVSAAPMPGTEGWEEEGDRNTPRAGDPGQCSWQQMQVGNISSTCARRDQALNITSPDGGNPLFAPAAKIFAVQRKWTASNDLIDLSPPVNNILHVVALLMAKRATELTINAPLGIVVTHSAMFAALKAFLPDPSPMADTHRKAIT